MSSLVELVFTAVGTEAAASAIDKVNDGLGETVRELGHLAVGAIGAKSAIEGVQEAFEEGAAFAHLSRRVGESVRELVVLEEAFAGADLGRETLTTGAAQLQKALGGVHDSGNRTEATLRRIGTTIEELRPLPFSQQLRVIAEGMATLATQSDKTNIAMTLFGRSGTQMLQLLGDPEGLALAEETAGRLGTRLEQNASAFQHVEDRLRVVNARLREMWVVAAEQLVPTLNTVAHLVSSLDLSGVGAFLGTAGVGAAGMVAFTAAFDFADRRLYSLLENMEEGTGRSIVRGASNAMGAVAAWTPWALAAGVTAQIVLGVIAAWQDAQVQKIFIEMRNVRAGVQPAANAVANVSSWDAASDARTTVQQQLEQARAELSSLQAKESAWANLSRLDAFTKPAQPFTEADFTRLQELERIVPKLQLELRKIEDPAAVAATLASNHLAAIRRELAPLVADLDKLEKKNAELRLKEMLPIERAGALQTERAALESQLRNVPAGLSADEMTARRLDLEDKLLKVQIQQRQTAEQISAELKKHAEEKKRAVDEEEKRTIFALTTQMQEAQLAGDIARQAALKREIEAKRALAGLSGVDLELAQRRLTVETQLAERDAQQVAARRQIEASKLALENSLNAIRENIARLEGDYAQTEAEKWTKRRDFIADEIKALEKMVKLEQDRAAAARAPGGAGEKVALEHEQASAHFGTQLSGARGEQSRLGADPNNWFQQTRKGITDLRNQWGTVAEGIASTITGTIGAAVNSISQSISGLVLGTMSWGQALANIGNTILTTVVESIVQMGVKWVAQKIMMAAADKSIAAANVAALIPVALATSALWAGPATLATIATFGGAAAAAPGEIAASMALTQGLALAKNGGYFPGGSDDDTAGIFHANEFVFSAPAVRAIGPANLAAMHASALQPAATPAAVGSAGGGSSAGSRESARNTYILLDRASFARAMQEDSRGWFREMSAAEMRKSS